MNGNISISGLTGGFDYNSVLQQIQYLKSQQILILQDRQNQIEQKKAVINEVKNFLNTMKSSLSNFDDPETLNAKTVKSSNENVANVSLTSQANVQLGTYNITVNQLAKNHIVAFGNTFSDKNASLGLSSGTLMIRQGNMELNIAYDSSYSLQSLADKINQEATYYNFDVKASVVNVGSSYRLVISSTKKGADYAISFDGDTAPFFSKLGNPTNIQDAQNAVITVNDEIFESSSNQFNNIIPGASITVKSLGDATITISQNSDPLKQALSNFVNSYNSLVDKINTETRKGGKLSGDYTLVQIKNSIFREVQDLVFSDILKFDRETGKLSINTSKLDQVMANTDTSSSPIIESRSQLFTKLSEIKTNLEPYLRETTLSTGTLGNMISAYDKQIASLQDSIDRMKNRVQMEIEILKRQFIMMESLQAQYNAIGARIQATFGLNNK